MNDQTHPYNFAGHADHVAETNKQYLLLDFTPASIAALDTFITEMWGEEGAAPEDDNWRPSEGKWMTILNFGAYFGEVMRRRFGGEWQCYENKPDDLLNARLALPGGMQVFPVAKVWKRFKNGYEDSIDPLFREVRRHAHDEPGPDEWADWLKQGNWFMGVRRPDHALPLFERAKLCPLTDDAARELEMALLAARTANAQQEQELRADEAPPDEAAAPAGGPDFKGAAERMAAALFHAGAVPNYSPASIAAADLSVNALMGLEPATGEQKEKYPELEWELGCYLGELFCRRLGGQWHAGSPFGIPTDDPLCYHIIWPSGFMTCPFAYISKRLENGAQHSIFGQFDQCRSILFERGDIPDLCDNPQEWYEQGYIIAVNQQRPNLGGGFLRMALKLDPNHVDALLWLAKICPETEEGRAKAHQLLQRALAVTPDHQQCWVATVRLHLAAGDREAALTSLQTALQHLPDDPELNELLGDQLAFRKDIPGAAEAYAKGTKRGDSAHAWEGLGICRQLTGDCEGAIEAWRQAADRDQSRPMPCYRAGAAEEQQGNKLKALQWYQRALERNPDAVWTARITERIAALDTDPALLREQADQFAQAGKTAESVAVYEKLAALDPADVGAWREAAVGYAVLQEFEKALSCFDKGLRADPADIKSYDHKAVTLARMGKIPLALDVIDEGLSRCLEAAALWVRRAYLLVRLKRFQEAVTSANKALELAPEEGRAYLFRYDAQRELGQTAAAIETITQYIDWIKPKDANKAIEAMRMRWELEHNAKLDQNMAQELQEYAFQHWQSGDADKALKCFAAAVESDPFSYEIWNNYGSALSGIGRLEEAVGCFGRADELYPLVTTFLSNKALALTRLFRNEEALACREQLLQRYAGDEESLEERVRLLDLLERNEEALAAAEAFAAACPERGEAYVRLSRILGKLGRHGDALTAIDRAIAKTPDNRRLWLNKSIILGDLGRHDEAEELQSQAFSDPEFAEQYHQEGLRMMDMMMGVGTS